MTNIQYRSPPHRHPEVAAQPNNRTMTGVFAHLGGIDEIGIYLIPILLAIATVRWAEKRNRSAADKRKTKTHSRFEEPGD